MIKIHACVAYGLTVKTELNVSQVGWCWLVQLYWFQLWHQTSKIDDNMQKTCGKLPNIEYLFACRT